jgi:phospholipase C
LVNVIVTAVGIPPTGGSGGNGDGGEAGHPPQAFRPFTVAVRLDIFKPGASAPDATSLQHVDIALATSRNFLVFALAATATDADLNADWRVEATSAPSGFAARYTSVTAHLNVTVRYQAVSGNLGKIDHIVALMMENRSFDHMLGSLSLPLAQGGQGRSDVEGLNGTEYNLDVSGAKKCVHLRQAPNSRQPDTAFLTDPDHDWDGIVQQLSGDTRDPKLTSNAGFVVNFAKKIDDDVKNLPPGTQSVSDVTQIDGGGSHPITFRPTLPGRITVEATPTHPPNHSETGLLGSIGLRMPGSAADLYSTKTPIGSPGLALTYEATGAQLARPGNWICTVTNGTEASLSFKTTITYVSEPHNTSNQELPDAVMSYYNASQLPVYYFFAENFAICDRWYASLPTDTWPNRLYALTGGSGGLTETPSDSAVEQGPPGYLLKTIFEVLQEHQIDWKVFFSDLPFALIFTRLAQDATYTACMRSIDELIQRAATGDLPSFCWVDPNFQDVPDDPNAASDDHPPGDVCRGQHLIHRVYSALASSPAWAKTLLVITYDEHGGFYDHVLPPRTIAVVATPDEGPRPTERLPEGPPDDNPRFRAYGVRVPTFIVSPWVAPKSVSHQVYDHTSLLCTVLHRFCRAADGSVPSMGARADHALSLEAMLSAEAPALNARAAPVLSGNCQGVQGPVVDYNTFGKALRKALFRF